MDGFTPLQFLPQDMKVVISLHREDQLQRMRRPPDFDHIAMTQGGANLAVEGDQDVFIGRLQHNFYFHRIREYKRTLSERIRADRREDQGLDVRIQNRTASGS